MWNIIIEIIDLFVNTIFKTATGITKSIGNLIIEMWNFLDVLDVFKMPIVILSLFSAFITLLNMAIKKAIK